MRSKITSVTKWRRLGWLTLVAFTLKGIASTALIVWAAMSVAPWR